MNKTTYQIIFLSISAGIFICLQSVNGELLSDNKHIAKSNNQPYINTKSRIASNIKIASQKTPLEEFIRKIKYRNKDYDIEMEFYDAKFNETDIKALIFFLSEHYDELLAQLLEEDIKKHKNLKNERGKPLLYNALYHKQTQMVKLLLNYGANPDLKSEWATPPCYVAASNNDSMSLELLIKKGADPLAKDDRGFTPLMIAACSGATDAIKTLVKHGVDPNHPGGSPLRLAALGDQYEAVKVFVNLGADVTLTDSDGVTPLHSVAQDGPVEIVKFLIDHGANPNAICRGNEDPLKWAHYGKNQPVIEFLTSDYVLNKAYTEKTHTYKVRPGDTLSELTLIFAKNLDYFEIAQKNKISNPDLIVTDSHINMPSIKPIRILAVFLQATKYYQPKKAYSLLSITTRQRYSFNEFKNSYKTMTIYDLSGLKVCSDFFINNNHMIQIKVDPAGVAFNLINENNQWRIILSELKPISPSDKGPLGWRCK